MSQSYDEDAERAPRDADRDAAPGIRRQGHHDEPDVLLDVAELRVDEISLEVEDLTARVSLQADVLDLLKLHVGVDAAVGGVQLTIKGVEAKALLKVRLDNVARILDRVFRTIDDNPEILRQLTEQVGRTAVEVGAGAGEVAGAVAPAASSTVAAVGESGRAAIDEAGKGAGEIVEDLDHGTVNTGDDLAEEAHQRSSGKERRPPARSRPRPTPSSTGGSVKRARRPRDRGPEEG